MPLEQKRRYEKAGRHAETLAALYLRVKGYHILERRYKTRCGEIDIIARRKDTLVIAEVKQRQTRLAAHESISAASERRIEDAANIYVSKTRAVQNLGIRFDAIFFIGPLNIWRWKVEHIKGAW